ncbi:hypothetical protein [Zophobihabitans entericus]|uniref:Conjugal transfer protein TrbH n=1 Tax=Zophobihabitans entericus TaxID=1635327 RepID=A0A6G9IFA9_9GAMM|nr:hypothetical protein [Zophobihabitans entericus]QIQ22517.1 hypothetical protein IPMB12_11970 [Zophobihabitans entericus]
MKKLFLILLMSIVLSGCVSSAKYGNFSAETLSNEVNIAFADNAFAQLSALYAPGKTRFNLTHQFSDLFGSHLSDQLQKAGYALSVPVADKDKTPEKAPEFNADTHSLAYVIDETDANIYRVTLFVDGLPITKGFLIQDGKVVSLGFWTKQDRGQ